MSRATFPEPTIVTRACIEAARAVAAWDQLLTLPRISLDVSEPIVASEVGFPCRHQFLARLTVVGVFADLACSVLDVPRSYQKDEIPFCHINGDLVIPNEIDYTGGDPADDNAWEYGFQYGHRMISDYSIGCVVAVIEALLKKGSLTQRDVSACIAKREGRSGIRRRSHDATMRRLEQQYGRQAAQQSAG